MYVNQVINLVFISENVDQFDLNELTSIMLEFFIFTLDFHFL